MLKDDLTIETIGKIDIFALAEYEKQTLFETLFKSIVGFVKSSTDSRACACLDTSEAAKPSILPCV